MLAQTPLATGICSNIKCNQNIALKSHSRFTRLYSVVVITPDFDLDKHSGNPGSNPGTTFLSWLLFGSWVFDLVE
jgi:hypothetical protein